MRHVVRTVRTDHDVVDSELAEVIELTQQDVWDRLDAEAGDMSDLIAAAEAVASVDGDFNARERRVLEELRQRFGKR